MQSDTQQKPVEKTAENEGEMQTDTHLFGTRFRFHLESVAMHIGCTSFLLFLKEPTSSLLRHPKKNMDYHMDLPTRVPPTSRLPYIWHRLYSLFNSSPTSTLLFTPPTRTPHMNSPPSFAAERRAPDGVTSETQQHCHGKDQSQCSLS